MIIKTWYKPFVGQFLPTKLIQKGLDFGWEQSVTGPPS
jgi:hypothetical protein